MHAIAVQTCYIEVSQRPTKMQVTVSSHQTPFPATLGKSTDLGRRSKAQAIAMKENATNMRSGSTPTHHRHLSIAKAHALLNFMQHAVQLKLNPAD